MVTSLMHLSLNVLLSGQAHLNTNAAAVRLIVSGDSKPRPAQLGADTSLIQHLEGLNGDPQQDDTTATASTAATIQDEQAAGHKTVALDLPAKQHKRKRATPADSDNKSIRIPHFSMPKELPKDELPHHRKLRKNASILDSLSVQIGHGRGGMKKKKMEWEWNARMQVSRRKFAL